MALKQERDGVYLLVLSPFFTEVLAFSGHLLLLKSELYIIKILLLLATRGGRCCLQGF
jgi:hypothetical protein